MLTEAQEQTILCRYLDRPDKDFVYYAVPNAGKRSPAQRALMKRTGLKAGVPDIIIHWPVQIALELKRSDGGRLSKTQKEWLATFDRIGWHTMVPHGARDAIAQIEAVIAAQP